MKLQFFLPFLALLAESSPLNRRAPSFDYANNKVRGVNLGGWLVLEPWITPSFFEQWASTREVIDEYTWSAKLGKQEARNRLCKHWETFITEPDIKAIAAAGLNHVRIPIGYWAITPLDGEPYVQGQLAFMDKAIQWARGAGLKVMLDLHAAPGSQNGFDNSGRNGSANWLKGDTVKQTTDALIALSKRYANQSDTIASIELLNEPNHYVIENRPAIESFYTSAAAAVRQASPQPAIVFHEAFYNVTSWNGFLNGTPNVVLDTHPYQIFNPGENLRSPAQHVEAACAFARDQLRASTQRVIAGEWTGAQTDCAKWLNRVGNGARYDGTYLGMPKAGDCKGKSTGTVAALSADDKKNIRSYIEAQLDAYETSAGWIFWTWKTESAPEWHMKDLLAGGLFPQPLTDRQFPNQCGGAYEASPSGGNGTNTTTVPTYEQDIQPEQY